MPAHRLDNAMLTIADRTLFTDVAQSIAAVADPLDHGVFLIHNASTEADRHEVSLGQPHAADGYVAGYRFSPWWMKPAVGSELAQLPADTQFLYLRRSDGQYVVVLSMLDGPFRSCFQGAADDHLQANTQTGDPNVKGQNVTVAFVAIGDNPFTLMEQAAESVMARMKTGRLRRDKATPGIVDLFGWCTWDAFYQEVSHDKVKEGLESFRAAGVEPRFMILDDGWQSIRPISEDKVERAVTAFEANDKFPGDLANTVRLAKDEYGVELFLVWHAMQGYWSGVAEEFADYNAKPTQKNWSPEIVATNEKLANDRPANLVPTQHIGRFFNDYHRHLMLQGVDGVKTDSQCVLEALAVGEGGRVKLMQAYHAALEGSTHVHFRGNLINCMSCSTDMIYSALNSNLTRSSDDFFPSRPETHGMHIWANAISSLFMGEFVHPDWDMFQSGHAMGAFHAMARAVSGGPVYVSDKPGQHDARVLRKLTFTDGSVPLCDEIGRPTADCLFADLAVEPKLLKVFNHNALGGVVAAFNIQASENEGGSSPTISGVVRPSDVDGLEGEQFVIYLHHAGTCHVVGFDEGVELSLPPLTAEIATIAPVENGLAIIGLTSKYNSGATAEELVSESADVCQLLVRDGGPLLMYTEREPHAIHANEADIDYAFDAKTKLLTVTLPEGAPVMLTVKFARR